MKRKILRRLNKFWCNFCKKLKLKKRVLFFTIRKNGALEENLKAVYDELDCKKAIFAHTLPHSKLLNAIAYFKILTSKVIVTDDYCRYLTAVKLKNNQSFIQLWHAAGAFKRFGLDDVNSIFTKQEEKAYHSGYTFVCVSGEEVKKHYANAFGIDENKCIATGLARTDLLIKSKEKYKKEIFKLLELEENKKIYLYCPTFREENGKKIAFNPEIDFDKLSRELYENEIFIIHRHPAMKESFLKKEYPNIMDLSSVETGKILAASKCLITDYSSVIYDALLLDVPCVFYCPDIEKYSRGFYFNFPDDLPGEMITSPKEILKAARQAVLSEKAFDFRKKQLSCCDGEAVKRIVNVIKGELEK